MTKKKDTAPKNQTPEPQTEAPTSDTVLVLGPDGPVYLTPTPIYFKGGKAELPIDLAAVLVNDKAAPGRYKLAQG